MALSIPNHVDPAAVQKIHNVVDSLRAFTLSQARGRRGVEPELEVRFCLCEGGGLTESAWTGIISAMEMNQSWADTTEWNEIVDFFFNITIDQDTVPVRTSRTLSEDKKIEIEHVRKNRINQCFVDVRNCESVTTRAKIVFSTEETIPTAQLPKVASTTNVRIKHRKSFFWGNWRYDATKSWSAASYSQATQLRDMQKDTRYEFEVELTNAQAYLEQHSNEYIALSLLLKVGGVLPPGCQICP